MEPEDAAISQDQSAIVVSTTRATAFPSRNGKIATTTPGPALNASSVVKSNSHLETAAVAFIGTPATETAAATPTVTLMNTAEATSTAAVAPAAEAPAVTPVNHGVPRYVVLPLGKENALNAALPPASNAIIQTSSLSSAVSSSSCTVISSSSFGKPRPNVALLRQPIHTAGPAAASVATATQSGSNIVINSITNLKTAPATAAASVATVGSGLCLQASLVNKQLDSSVPATATTQVMKSESQKTIVLAVSQHNTLTASHQPTTRANKIIEQTREGGMPNPSEVSPLLPPAPGTSTGMTKGTINTGARNLPKTSTTTTGGVPALHLLSKPQNPTNIQRINLPPGMVLLRSENGQLFMVTQQTLAEMQAKTQSKHGNTKASCSATTTGGPPVQKSTVQVPRTPIVVTQQVTPATTVKQAPQAQKTVQPSPLQPIVLQHSAAVPPRIAGSGSAQTAALGTASTAQPGTPQVAGRGATTILVATTDATENGRKCKNFLSTLIKITSSRKQCTETAAKVKELVQNLLDAKIEVEDFTIRLYRELNSSPQPYLVPFLKSSLPALRQLIPDPALFIQQSEQEEVTTQTTSAQRAVEPSSSVQLTAGKTSATVPAALPPPVSRQPQPAPVSVSNQGQPGKPAVLRPPPIILTQTPKAPSLQPLSGLMLTTPRQIQVNQLKTIPAFKLPGTEFLSNVSAQATAAQKNQPKEPEAGSLYDNDDINDVTVMAGVNLVEESARILPTNSQLAGTLARSCQDEAFLLSAPLQRRILEIAKKHEITALHPDVVSYVSLATQKRLQNLVEKVSTIAQHKYISHKSDERYEQISDVRAQLKFFEQLDRIAKQRKDDQERKVLMRAAMSRSRREDPEQLMLKQKAKELQERELAQKRQRDADLAALDAIGPRRKKKAGFMEPGATFPSTSGVGRTKQSTPQSKTRVNLRDLILCLENERETRHSLLLYKAFLK